MDRRSFLGTGTGVAAAIATPGLTTLPFLRSAGDYRPGLAPDKPIRLSANENPLGMSDWAKRAILEGMTETNRYPRRDDDLRAAIAAKHAVKSTNVVLGAGSTDVLRMAVQSLAMPGARVVLPDPTFEHVEAYSKPFIPDIVKVPLAADHSLDLDAMLAAAKAAKGPVLLFICNPNNPTGTITPCADVEAAIAASPETFTFLVDEAYFDFVEDPGYHTLIPLINRPNVIVSRTFSKVYGLAGLRAGYGLTAPATAARMERVMLKNTINHFAGAAVLASINDTAFMKRSVENNRQGRAVAQKALAELEIEALPSHTNFIMHRIRGSLSDYIAHMAEEGIQVGRAFPPMLEYNRVSIGTPDQMGVWADSLRKFRAKGWV
jgi:histidinol-phosphate aminotransferase